MTASNVFVSLANFIIHFLVLQKYFLLVMKVANKGEVRNWVLEKVIYW